MTNKQYKRGEISPLQIFFMLVISRIVVSFTYVQAVSVGKLSSDLLISILLSNLFVLTASIPIYICLKNNKNPADYPVLGILYCAYFLYFSAISVSRFSYFASSQIGSSIPTPLFAVLICICAGYCAILGIEGIGRFSLFCGALLITMLIVVLSLNLDDFSFINFYPIVQNSKLSILKNAVLFMSNSVEPAVMLIVSKHINGKKITPLLFSSVASGATIFTLIFFCIGVMGSAATVQAYPIFSLSQLASIESMSRLDMLHTAFWVVSLLLKSSLLIYASSICFVKGGHITKCIAFSIAVIASSFVITELIGTAIINVAKIISVSFFCALTIASPLVLIFIKRKNSNENS